MSTRTSIESRNDTPRKLNEDAAFELVRAALRQLQFGSVTIVVQNGRVVQIDRNEKTRLTPTD